MDKVRTSHSGQIVSLIPLEEMHFAELLDLAAKKEIWEHYRRDCSNPLRLQGLLQQALPEWKNGGQYPFVMYHKADDRIIGSTRLMDTQPEHQKPEIGWTWLHPESAAAF